MKMSLVVLVSAGAVMGLLAVGSSPAQQPAAAAKNNALEGTSPNPFGENPAVLRYSLFSEAPSGRSEIEQIMRQLRETEDTAKKAELTKQLEAAVSKHFDEDLKTREEELEKLEQRVSKLKAQLERRRKAKADITQLQIKVLINDAEGLGFSDAWPSATGTGRRPATSSQATPWYTTPPTRTESDVR